MNYYAHGWQFVDDPYFLAGTAVPDWLNVVDRKVRARSVAARNWQEDPDPRLAAVARGVLRHHEDDGWFHQTRVFQELTWHFTLALRDQLADNEGFRPGFVGHILVELLLDAELIADQPAGLDAYYAAVENLDLAAIQEAVERITSRPVPRLGEWIQRFCRERFLYDYVEDAKLLARLNGVMRRVGLPQLPASLADWFPVARRSVALHRHPLLARPAPGPGRQVADDPSGPAAPPGNSAT